MLAHQSVIQIFIFVSIEKVLILFFIKVNYSFIKVISVLFFLKKPLLNIIFIRFQDLKKIFA